MHNKSHPNTPPREKQRKTAVTLSVITCVFMCVMGYEIIRDNQATAGIDTPPDASQKPILFSNLPSITDSDENGELGRQIKLLTAQNRVQGQKMRELREELQETTRKLHEIRITLLDKKHYVTVQKVDELQQQIADKDRLNQEMLDKISWLESELTDNRKRSHQMEMTIDALTDMVDLHKTTKEKAYENYSQQISKLQGLAENERDNLLSSIQQYEERVNQIHTELEKKSVDVALLEQELTRQNAIIEGRTKELQSLTLSHNNSHEKLTAFEAQVQQFEAILDNERAVASSLQQQLDEAKHQYENEKKRADEMQGRLDIAIARVSDLEKELTAHQNALTAKSEEIAAQQQTNNDKLDLNAQITALREELQHEQGKALTLLDELNTLVNHYEGEQQTTTELEKQLRHIERELAHKHQVLNVLNDAHEQMLTENKTLREALEDKSTAYGEVLQKIQEIQTDAIIGYISGNDWDAQLRELKETHEREHTEQIAALETQIRSHTEKSADLERQLSEHSNYISIKDQELQDIEERHLSSANELNDQILTLSAELEKEKLKGAALEEELDQLRYKYQMENDIVLELDYKMTSVQALLLQHEKTLSQKDEAIQKKEEELNTLQSLNQELQKENALLLKEGNIDAATLAETIHTASLIQLQELETQNNQYASLQVELEKELATNREELHNQQNDMQKLRSTLEEYAAHGELNSDLENKLQDLVALLTHKENEIERHTNEIQRLERELESNKTASSISHSEIEQLRAAADALELEKQQREEINGRYLEAVSQHEEQLKKAQSLEGKLQEITELLNDKETTLRLKAEREMLLEREIDAQNERLSTHKEELEALKEAQALLQNEANEVSVLNEKMREEKEKEAQLESQLFDALDRYHAEHDNASRLEEELASLKIALADKEESIRTAEHELSNLKAHQSVLIHDLTVVPHLSEHLQSTLASEQNLQRQLQDALALGDHENQTVALLKDRLQKASSEIHEKEALLQKHLESHTGTTEELQVQLSDALNKWNTTRQSLLEKEQQLIQLGDTLSEKEKTLAELMIEHPNAVNQLHEEQIQAKEMQANYEAALANYEKEHQAALEKEQLIEELRLALVDKEQSMTQDMHFTEKMKAELEAQRAEALNFQHEKEEFEERYLQEKKHAEELQTKLHEIADTLQHQTISAEEQIQELSTLRQEIQLKEKELYKLKSAQDALQEKALEIPELAKALQENKIQLEAQHNASAEREKQLEQLREELAQKEEAFRLENKEKEDIQSKLEAQSRIVDQYKEELETLRQQYEEDRAAAEETRQKWESAARGLEVSDQAIHQHEEELAKTKAELEEKQRELAQAKEEQKALADRLEEIPTLSRSLQEQKQLIDSAQVTVEAKEKEINELRQQLQQKEEALNAGHQTKEEIDSQAALQAQLVAQYKEELEALQEQYEQEQQAAQASREKWESAASQLNERDTASQAKEEELLQTKRLLEEKQHELAQAKEEQKALADRLEEIPTLSRSLQEQKQQLDSVKFDTEAKIREINELRQQLQQKEEALNAGNQTKEEIEAQAASQSRIVEQYKEELQALQKRYEQEQQEAEISRQQWTTTLSQLNDSDTAVQAKEQELLQTKEMLEEKIRELESAREEQSSLRNRLEEIPALSRSVQEQQQRFEAAQTDAQQMIKTAKQIAEDKETEIRQLKQMIRERELTLESGNQTVQQLQSQLESMQQRFEEEQKALADAQNQLRNASQGIDAHQVAILTKEEELNKTRQSLEEKTLELYQTKAEQEQLRMKTTEIPDLSKALNEQQNKAATLEKYLQETNEQFQSAKQNAVALEQKIAELSKQLLEKEADALADHYKLLEELDKQREAANEAQLEVQRLRSQAKEVAQTTNPSPTPLNPGAPSPTPEPIPTAPTKEKISMKNGDVYEGDVVGGKRTGKGKYLAKNGSVYEGDFVNGVRTGKGKLTLSNGTVYEGDFVNGKANGQGKLVQSNGTIQEGRFEDGKFAGK